MPFSLQRFSHLRSHLYHVTHWQNVERIKRTSLFESAGVLLTKAQRLDVARRRRAHALPVTIDGEPTVITDLRLACTKVTSVLEMAGNLRI